MKSLPPGRVAPRRPPRRRRRGGLLVWVCGIPLGLLALGLFLGLRGSRPRAELAFNNGTQIPSLDPAVASGLPEGRVLRCLYEGLVVKHPRTLEPLPGMAESWQLSADQRTYTFELRRAARWTNGAPVTAHDFVASWKRLLDPRTGAAYGKELWRVRGARAWSTELDASGAPRRAFDEVGLRARGDHVLEVELEQPWTAFLDLVSLPALLPVNTAALAAARERYPDDWQRRWLGPDELVTNGPFRLVEQRVHERMRLARNPDYWDARNVGLATLDIWALENLTTAFNLYVAGELDLLTEVPAPLVPRLLGRADFHPTPVLGTYFYRFNTTRAPLDDARVRRALSLVLPRESIATSVAGAGEVPAWSFVPPGLAGYAGARLDRVCGVDIDGLEGIDNDSVVTRGVIDDAPADDVANISASPGDGARAAVARAAVASASTNVDATTGPSTSDGRATSRELSRRARLLLAQAGYGPGARAFPTLELSYNTQGRHREIAEICAEVWQRELGVRVVLAGRETKTFLDAQRNRDYDISRSSWIGDWPDAANFLEVFASANENNRTGWSNAEFDALLQSAEHTSGAERMARLGEAEGILLAEAPLAPVYYYVSRNLVRPGLAGFEPNVLDEHPPKFWSWRR